MTPERWQKVAELCDSALSLEPSRRAAFLEAVDPRRSRVVELRFFGGLSVEETAEFMGISPETVKRDWRVAKLWLMKELSQGAPFTARGSSPPAR